MSRSCLRKLSLSLVVFATTLGLTWAEDEVYRRTASVPLRGTVEAENAREITIRRKDTGKSETVSIYDLAKVKYEGGKTAADLTQAESLERAGEYQKAIDAFSRLAKESSGKVFLERAAQFGQISSLAKQAMRDATRGEAAIQGLEDFRKQNPDSRYHYAIHEMLGQLYRAKKDGASARAAFAELGSAPWLEFQLKAKNYEARLLLDAGELDRALEKFEEVIKSAGEAMEERIRRFDALVGQADCLVKKKKFQEAEPVLRDVIANSSSEDAAIHAAAFNLLGDVMRDTGREKESLYCYLYVDTFYGGERQEHAKALCYLSLLWAQRGRADRAEEARSRLKKDYPNSPWVQVADAQGKPQ